MTRHRYLVGTYTHKCKAYVEKEFYAALAGAQQVGRGDAFLTIDNSPGERYVRRLEKRYGEHCEFRHLDIAPRSGSRQTFLNNVALSINELRSTLLESDFDHLITVESDVLVPPDLTTLFDEAITQLDDAGENWGAIGGLYYAFYHKALQDPADHRLFQDTAVFSGCTCYNKKMLAEIPFRWSEEDTGPFPDSWMKHDGMQRGYSMWFYNKIKCRHKRGRWFHYFWH